MFFQCSVFWAKAANPFDSEVLQKEANAVFAVLLLFIYLFFTKILDTQKVFFFNGAFRIILIFPS